MEYKQHVFGHFGEYDVSVATLALWDDAVTVAKRPIQRIIGHISN